MCVRVRDVPLYIHAENVHAGVWFCEFGVSCDFGTGQALWIAGNLGFNSTINNQEKNPA